MTLPEIMRAVVAERPGGPEVLAVVERLLPAPGPGQVLVRVAAAGVNRPDVIQRMGLYPPPPGVTDVLGLEIAGEVVALGNGVPTEARSTQVAALVPGGGYAEFCLADWGCCLPVPDGLPLEQAAALPETLFTVWHNLAERGGAWTGDRVLVHGGTSGIGTTAIRLGALLGLEVIVTCGSDAKVAQARELGAAHAINYRETDFVAAVAAITGGEGVRIVLDMVGGEYLARNLRCLAEEGCHVSIAFQLGATAELPIPLVMQRRLMLTGSTLRPRTIGWKADLTARILEQAWLWVADGRLRPVMDRVFPLADVVDAHRRIDGGDHLGKIVLSMTRS